MRRALPLTLACLAALAAAPAPSRAGAVARARVVEGRLAGDDPRDAVRKQSGHRVHEVTLEAGTCYQIDLDSPDFDPFLRLEDAQQRQLAFNDDIDYANRVLDARLFFAPFETAAYRLVVTSSKGGTAGD